MIVPITEIAWTAPACVRACGEEKTAVKVMHFSQFKSL